MECLILQRAESDWFRFYQKHGDKFDQRFLRVLKLLEKNPEMGPVFRAKPFRKLILVGYPIGIFYTLNANRIIITCLLDLRQSTESIIEELDCLDT